MTRKKQLKMRDDNSGRFILIISVLILLSMACNVPIIASQSQQEKLPGFVETSVAETMIALDNSQAQDGSGSSSSDSSDEAVSDTPDITNTPDFTDTPTLTPTVTDTPTPEVAMIHVSANTNCRTGQSVDFPWLVSLQAGEEVEAFGVDPTGEYDYWYIRRPDQPNSFCWLWGKYATPSGPFESLPVFTPMPTPTPGFDFKVTYHSKIGPCPAIGLQYQIDNIGAFTLESWKTTATDHDGGSNPVATELDAFVQLSPACAFVNSQQDLTPGEGFYVVMVFNGDPTGHDISTKIKICQEDGLGGDCLSKTIRHTP